MSRLVSRRSFSRASLCSLSRSIGWNPTFNNKNKTAEVHVLKKYDSDFYNENIRVIILGFVRPMTKFSSLGSPSIHSKRSQMQSLCPLYLIFYFS